MSLLKAKVTIQPKPIVITKTPQTALPLPEEKVKRHVELEMEEIESGFEFPTVHRGSMYDFKLDALNEKQRRFVVLPEGLTMVTLKSALTQHIAIEREAREFRQNFRTLPAEVNGKEGYYVYCMSIEDMPMRKHNKNKDEGETAQAQVA
jgi:hypothetical protein